MNYFTSHTLKSSLFVYLVTKRIRAKIDKESNKSAVLKRKYCSHSHHLQLFHHFQIHPWTWSAQKHVENTQWKRTSHVTTMGKVATKTMFHSHLPAIFRAVFHYGQYQKNTTWWGNLKRTKWKPGWNRAPSSSNGKGKLSTSAWLLIVQTRDSIAHTRWIKY